ncbi:MAG: aminotransferase class V-fold PLP-dependent enzyme [Candidatus Eremiobacteraeota bacterium]|nr:aminotransferase class V-fold PLP-dependent enzyme [Candidatus Eremiobacteraeota bacterium]
MTPGQSETPYLDALKAHLATKVRSFHMPGHQGGRGVSSRLLELIGPEVLRADLTQVHGLDDIHRPDGPCGQAQRLAAEAYGADHTYFLVNGSSSGNQIMAMAALDQGDSVLVARNAHRSTLAGVLLAGAEPVYYQGPYNPTMQVFEPPRLEHLEAAWRPGLTAVWLTNPSYYGASGPIQELVDWAHRRGLICLVDEAWGAHLHFHPDLPPSALTAGADLVVQSVHKTLGGLSQAAQLHFRRGRIEPARLQNWVRWLSSTSPFCPLLASIDAVRHQMVSQGRALLTQVIDLANQSRARLGELERVEVFAPPPAGDPTRVVARVVGYSGRELEAALYQGGVQVEMSDANQVVLLFSPGHQSEDVDHLVAAFQQLPARPPRPPRSHPWPPLPLQACTPRQALERPSQSVPLEQAVGRVGAELVTPYPPGIPVLYPGEVISAEAVDYLKLEQAWGVDIEGAFDSTLKTLRVIT